MVVNGYTETKSVMDGNYKRASVHISGSPSAIPSDIDRVTEHVKRQAPINRHQKGIEVSFLFYHQTLHRCGISLLSKQLLNKSTIKLNRSLITPITCKIFQNISVQTIFSNNCGKSMFIPVGGEGFSTSQHSKLTGINE